MVLTPVADKLSQKVGTECFNTEEMKRGIEDANQKLKAINTESTRRLENLENRLNNSVEKKDLVAISMDVKALYPSLDWE
jgi:hypothetical protein